MRKERGEKHATFPARIGRRGCLQGRWIDAPPNRSNSRGPYPDSGVEEAEAIGGTAKGEDLIVLWYG